MRLCLGPVKRKEQYDREGVVRGGVGSSDGRVCTDSVANLTQVRRTRLEMELGFVMRRSCWKRRRCWATHCAVRRAQKVTDTLSMATMNSKCLLPVQR